MRVAAVYDVHGNLPALEAVLADVAEEQVDAIVCGGDLVGGPYSAEVLDRLAGLPHAWFIRGNADRMVLEGTDEYSQDWDSERARLGEARVRAVGSWPLTVELEIDELGPVLFCHAVPTADEPIFTRMTPDADVEELLGEIDADVLVCGHTHVQFDRSLPSGLRIVNAGSVGMPYEGRRGAFWALLGPGVELRSTAYDVEAAVASIRGLGGDHGQLTEVLVTPPAADEATRFFESQRTGPRGT
jgi:putative phosphoesterase